VLSGCTRVSEGEAVAQPSGSETSTPSATIGAPSSAPDLDAPGVQPTQRTPLPANAITCGPETRPQVAVAATVADPDAPRLTVGVPDGWNFTRGTGDVGVTMQGPQGMSAAVTIAPTALDPEVAFREYTDAVMEKSAVTTVSILPGQLCGYSGQKLSGSWSDDPDTAVDFVDRIAHVWTDSGDYLVAIHVEGPATADGLGAASTTLTDDVELTIP
jgi:hypothetical protein